MAVTIKDVAKMAEVSISTVSRVINNSKPVSKEVKERVVKAIDELGYTPNEVARSLVTKKSNLIGVIVTDIGNSYIAQMVRGIEEVGRMYGYDIILTSSYGLVDNENRFVDLLRTKQVEGVILISEIVNEGIIERLKSSSKPYMYLNRYYIDPKLPTVSIDSEEASFKMTEYIMELGHKNILYLTANMDVETSLEKHKLEGYRKAIGQLENPKEFIYSAEGFTIEDGYHAGEKLLAFIKEKNITAVFCSHDQLAIGLINYLYDKGIRVPEDVSICGYGDSKIASTYRPMLTTVREPYYDIGAVAARRIIKELIDGEVDRTKTCLPIQIMKRESCGNY